MSEAFSVLSPDSTAMVVQNLGVFAEDELGAGDMGKDVDVEFVPVPKVAFP